MTEKETFIAAIEAADVTQDDWYWDAFEALTDKYAKGYLTAYKESAREYHGDDELRDDLIRAAKWDIWGK